MLPSKPRQKELPEKYQRKMEQRKHSQTSSDLKSQSFLSHSRAIKNMSETLKSKMMRHNTKYSDRYLSTKRNESALQQSKPPDTTNTYTSVYWLKVVYTLGEAETILKQWEI